MGSKIGHYFDRLKIDFSLNKQIYEDLSSWQKFTTVALSALAGLATLPFFGIGGIEVFNALVGRFMKLNKDANPNVKKTDDKANSILQQQQKTSQALQPVEDKPLTIQKSDESKSATTAKSEPATPSQKRQVDSLENNFEKLLVKIENQKADNRLDSLVQIVGASGLIFRYSNSAARLAKQIKNVELLEKLLKINEQLQEFKKDLADMFIDLHEEMTSKHFNLYSSKELGQYRKVLIFVKKLEIQKATDKVNKDSEEVARAIKQKTVQKEIDQVEELVKSIETKMQLMDEIIQSPKQGAKEYLQALAQIAETSKQLPSRYLISHWNSRIQLLSDEELTSKYVTAISELNAYTNTNRELIAGLFVDLNQEMKKPEFQDFSAEQLRDYQKVIAFMKTVNGKDAKDGSKIKEAEALLGQIEIQEKVKRVEKYIESIEEAVKSKSLNPPMTKALFARTSQEILNALANLSRHQNALSQKNRAASQMVSRLENVEMGDIIDRLQAARETNEKFLVSNTNSLFKQYLQVREHFFSNSNKKKITDKKIRDYQNALQLIGTLIDLSTSDLAKQSAGPLQIGDIQGKEEVVSLKTVKDSLSEDKKSIITFFQEKIKERKEAQARAERERRRALADSITKSQRSEALLLGSALTEKRTKSATRPPNKGIRNNGNTCYLNSSLQVLLHSSLADRIDHEIDPKKVNPPNPFEIEEHVQLTDQQSQQLTALVSSINQPDQKSGFVNKVEELKKTLFENGKTWKNLDKETLDSYQKILTYIVDQRLQNDVSFLQKELKKIRAKFSRFDFHNQEKQKLKANLSALRLFRDVYDGHIVRDSANKTIDLTRAAKYLRLVAKSSDTSLCPGLKGNLLTKQEDAQEYLQGLLESIGYGFTVNTITTAAGEVPSKHDEPSSMITLQIEKGKSFEQLINSYSLENIDDPKNLWRGHRKYKKTISIVGEIPDQIVINLKRFQHTAFGSQKISDTVKIPEKIDLAPMIDASLKKDGTSTKYRLKAYVHHSGGVGGGHYIANVNHGNKWSKHEDSNVTSLSHKSEKSYRNKSYIYVFERIK